MSPHRGTDVKYESFCEFLARDREPYIIHPSRQFASVYGQTLVSTGKPFFSHDHFRRRVVEKLCMGCLLADPRTKLREALHGESFGKWEIRYESAELAALFHRWRGMEFDEARFLVADVTTVAADRTPSVKRKASQMWKRLSSRRISWRSSTKSANVSLADRPRPFIESKRIIETHAPPVYAAAGYIEIAERILARSQRMGDLVFFLYAFLLNARFDLQKPPFLTRSEHVPEIQFFTLESSASMRKIFGNDPRSVLPFLNDPLNGTILDEADVILLMLFSPQYMYRGFRSETAAHMSLSERVEVLFDYLQSQTQVLLHRMLMFPQRPFIIGAPHSRRFSNLTRHLLRVANWTEEASKSTDVSPECGRENENESP